MPLFDCGSLPLHQMMRAFAKQNIMDMSYRNAILDNDTVQLRFIAHTMVEDVEDSSRQKASPVRPRITLAFRAAEPFNHRVIAGTPFWAAPVHAHAWE
jgi:hypothetical protein